MEPGLCSVPKNKLQILGGELPDSERYEEVEEYDDYEDESPSYGTGLYCGYDTINSNGGYAGPSYSNTAYSNGLTLTAEQIGPY